MKKLFVPYEIAVKITELGFNEPCFAGWTTDGEFAEPDNELNVFRTRNRSGGEISAPLYQQVIDWLREKHKIHVAASSFHVYGEKYGYQYSRLSNSSGWTPHFEGNSYYDALNKAIEEGLDLVPKVKK